MASRLVGSFSTFFFLHNLARHLLEVRSWFIRRKKMWWFVSNLRSSPSIKAFWCVQKVILSSTYLNSLNQQQNPSRAVDIWNCDYLWNWQKSIYMAVFCHKAILKLKNYYFGSVWDGQNGHWVKSQYTIPVPRSQDVVVEPFFAILNYISDIASVLC